MTASDIEKFRFINIPGADMGRSLGESVEVRPIDDNWLLAKERTWEEIDYALEGRLLGVQKSLAGFEGEPNQLAKSYGIDRPIGGNVARLIAYSEMLNEYRVVEESHGKAAEATRDLYEKDKGEAKVTQSKGKYQITITELREKYDPEIKKHSDRANEATEMRTLFLRKAVMDVFSVKGNATDTGEPLVAQDFGKALADTKKVLAKGGGEQRVAYLVDCLSAYVEKTSDTRLFSRYAYRESSGVAMNLKDSMILEEGLAMAAGENGQQLQKLGNAFLDFLTHRASYLSSSRVGETYPHLSLIYDLAMAALYGNKAPVLETISNQIDRRYNPIVARRVLDAEIRTASRNLKGILGDSQLEAVKVIGNDAEADKERMECVKRYGQKTELRLSQLLTFNGMVGGFSEHITVGHSSTINAIRDRWLTLSPRLTPGEAEFMQALWPRLSLASECDLTTALMKLARVISYPESVISKDKPKTDAAQKLRVIREFDEAILAKPLAEQEQVKAERANYYLVNFFNETPETVEQLVRENAFLWDEILNNSLWFVSPRGDQFPVALNSDLYQNGIESLTFRIDRNRPREHKLTLTVGGTGNPFEFWLDTRRNLLDEARRPVVTDPRIREHFLNFTLRRLYLISSGLLGGETSDDERSGERREGQELIFRRAHYRVLSSTVRRKITMESDGAQDHAELIKRIYGIDIYEEMKRRRAIGTLRQDQYLTFVKETEPKIKEMLVLPNRLTYDSELVRIPE